MTFALCVTFDLCCIVVNAGIRFYTSSAVVMGFDEEGALQQQVTAPLHSVTNPEEKRKIIGDTFIKVADEALIQLDLQANEIFLAQGQRTLACGCMHPHMHIPPHTHAPHLYTLSHIRSLPLSFSRSQVPCDRT